MSAPLPADNLKSPGILLNNPAPRHRQLSSSQASSSSSTSDSRSRPSRRIRFAPLPEPRRDPPLTSPFYDSDSDAPSPCPPTPPDYPPSPRFTPRFNSPDDHSPTPKPKSWGQKLLAPLLSPLKQSNSSSNPDLHSPLLRTVSHDSSSEYKYKGGAPLERSMSTGSRPVSSTREAERSATFRDGDPLSHVLSEPTRLPPSNAANSTRGTRMLNGRVYGRRINSTDPSKTPANSEPEFVEWGYGGMGSVSTDHKGKPGTDWAKLQRQGKVLGNDDPDADDGSGMGWVRKRREQREREKKEREEKERIAEVPEITVHPPTEASKKDLPQGTEQGKNPEPEHHVYQAVSVPATTFNHHHRRRDSNHVHPKPTDGNATPTALSRTSSDNITTLSRASSNNTPTNTANQSALHPPQRDDADMSSGSSFTSTSTSSVDGEDDDDDNDTERDSDEDSDEETQGRITSKCAGVEKVSRHAKE